jgi:hypothetical protein
MPASDFTFISPGVQVQEIDRSGIPAVAPPIGPAVIGRSVRGPSMTPVRLESTADLYKIFGAPSPGGKGGDVWREGNFAAPTYGAFAAEAYLRNNGPVTFVRLAGEQHPDYTATLGEAGWAATEATGVFVASCVSGSGGNATQITASLGAVFYCAGNNTKIQLISHVAGDTAPTDTPLHLTQNESSNVRDLVFTAIVSGAVGNNADFAAETMTHLTATFDFDPNSEKYIRKVFNTNPHYTNTTLYNSGTVLNYWLGETFESSLQEIVCGGGPSSGSPSRVLAGDRQALAFVARMSDNTIDLANRSDAAAIAKSGLVFAQDITEETASYQPQNQQKLFRFAATDIRGEWDNKNIKVSIANVKAAVNPTVDPYGAFDVFVRDASDTDNSLSLLESFTGLNLNPASPNYIARRIGDRYLSWDTTEKYYEEYGTYTNVSKYIRMEMNDEVDNASANPAVLPFGYFGPIRTKTTGSTTSDASTTPIVIEAMPMFIAGTLTTGSAYNAAAAARKIINASGSLASTIEFPRISLRESGTYGVSTPKSAFYGARTQGTFARRDNGYGDYTRRISSNIEDPYGSGGTLAAGLEYSYIFSLDDVSGSATTPVYVSGSRADGESLRGIGSATGSLLDAGINSFTLPLVGGTDGLDITEPEPFANRLISGQSEQDSYELYSVRKAIDMLRDPDVVEHNVVAAPGLSDPLVTDYLVDMAEERKDTLAIIDIENDYKPRFELDSDDIGTNRTRLPDPSTAVTTMKTRGFDSSYGAAYYPAVQIRDRGSNTVLYVPATVAAISAFGYTERVAEPWFAPAGFNRGGLSDGSTGIVATGVSKRLSSKERDDLYGVNVNPIAQFPQEGIVIFGQKTLQARASALDRVNVRRLLIFLKKEISRIANTTLFQPNTRDTWAQFLLRARPLLDDVKAKFGLEDYRLILDETTTTPDLIDRNILYAKVLLKPTRAVEFIAIDFEIFRSGASFDS